MNYVRRSKQVTFSGWFDSAITAGAAIFQTVSSQQQANAVATGQQHPVCGQSQLKRDGDVAACLDSLWASYRQIERGGDAVSILQAANALQTAFNNPALFSPINSNGRNYLQQSKDVIAQSIREWSNPTSTTSPVTPVTTLPATGTTPTINTITNAVTGGASVGDFLENNKTLLLGGAAVVTLIALLSGRGGKK